MKLDFKKMQGIGNDFVIFDITKDSPLRDLDEKTLREFSVKVANPKFGVGCDGVMLVMPSEKQDYRMRIINADGSEAEMCGNGIRCFARFLFDHGLIKSKTFEVETLAGRIIPRINTDEKGNFESVTVNMGCAQLEPEKIPVDLSCCNNVSSAGLISFPLSVGEGRFNLTCVSMGNPHAILFVDDLDIDISRIGPIIENHSFFPKKTNVEFVELIDKNNINMRVWERGVGETLGCGTGSSAAAVACFLNGHTEKNVSVHLTGGSLDIEIGESLEVLMTGPAEYTFTGTLSSAFLSRYFKN